VVRLPEEDLTAAKDFYATISVDCLGA